MAKKNGQTVTLEEKIALTKKEALIHAESFYHYELIARASGVTDDTLKKYRDEDLEFSEQLEQARTRFLSKNMKKSKPEFLLERLEPKLFKERKENETTLILPKPIMDIPDAILRDNSNKEDSQAQ